jgi:hypothetical protein
MQRMPILIRIIAEKIIAIALAVLAFFGININLNLDNSTILSPEQRQELVDKILTDSNDEQINLKPENLLEIIEPKIAREDDNETLPFQQSILPENVSEVPTNTTVTPKNSQNDKLKVAEVTPNETTNPINIVFESITLPNKTEIQNQETNENIKDVVVNIICNQKNKNLITINSGSGVIISPQGVVITNAHIAQYFLLNKSLKYSCALYKENIPTFGYTAELIFISPDWIRENSAIIKTKSPRGTGENDYAFLYITGNTNPTLSKPDSFPYAQINIDYRPKIGDEISIAGYPGAPNSLADITKSVNLKLDNQNSIKDILTFGNNQMDIISTENSPVAFRGASGGGIFKRKTLDLIGVTVTTGGFEETSYINALTTRYINRDLKQDFDMTIFELISGDLLKKSENFWENYGESLAEILLAEL